MTKDGAMTKAEFLVKLKIVWAKFKTLRESHPEAAPEVRELFRAFLPIGWELFQRVKAEAKAKPSPDPELEIQEWV